MTPVQETDGFIICFEAEDEDVNMRQHFIRECGWTEDQFAGIEDFAWFSAKVSAWRGGKEWGAAYLGCCCYQTAEEFYTTYKDDYFAQKVEEAVASARTCLKAQGLPIPTVDRAAALAALRDTHGLTFGECVNAFGRDRDTDPYARAAHERHAEEGTLEVDATTVVSEGGDPGAYVMAWLWVSREAVVHTSDSP